MTDERTPHATVLLLGTMDTKGEEYGFVAERLNRAGIQTVVMDTGVLGAPGSKVDITRDAVAAAAGVDLASLVDSGDRGAAVERMAEGARSLVRSLVAEQRIDGVLALGGSGGTTLASHAFAEIPIGFPKVIVSTVASGDTRQYVGEGDLVLFPSVVDIAGLNRISTEILGNAAAAMAGMVSKPPVVSTDRPVIAASMFGVTTPCVNEARHRLEQSDLEVIVFHMTGAGGRSLERLVREGRVAAVLDATTTELADELVGGVFSAGSDRLTAAAETGVPQVVSVGALDMVNFGARDTVPERFADRRLLVHNASVTLMRTTPAECAELGRTVAERVSRSSGPATIVLPLGGISAVSVPGGPFYDAEADAALFDAIRSHVDRDRVDLVELDADINAPLVASTMASIAAGYAAGSERFDREDRP